MWSILLSSWDICVEVSSPGQLVTTNNDKSEPPAQHWHTSPVCFQTYRDASKIRCTYILILIDQVTKWHITQVIMMVCWCWLPRTGARLSGELGCLGRTADMQPVTQQQWPPPRHPPPSPDPSYTTIHAKIESPSPFHFQSQSLLFEEIKFSKFTQFSLKVCSEAGHSSVAFSLGSRFILLLL